MESPSSAEPLMKRPAIVSTEPTIAAIPAGREKRRSRSRISAGSGRVKAARILGAGGYAPPPREPGTGSSSGSAGERTG